MNSKNKKNKIWVKKVRRENWTIYKLRLFKRKIKKAKLQFAQCPYCIRLYKILEHVN